MPVSMFLKMAAKISAKHCFLRKLSTNNFSAYSILCSLFFTVYLFMFVFTGMHTGEKYAYTLTNSNKTVTNRYVPFTHTHTQARE